MLLDNEEKPFRHRYSTEVIQLSMDLYREASIGYQTISNVIKVISKQLISIPHYSTVRLWITRAGCYTLNKPIERGQDWVAIGDLTIDVGKVKCLAILGTRMNKLESRGDYILSHEDVVLLGLHPTEKSTGEFNYDSFTETLKGDFQALVIDQGSDIKMGARLFSNNNPNIKIIFDIAHKLSLIVEHELKNDPIWKSYTQKLTETGRLLAQTEFAALKPGNQRSKARFMDVGYLIRWRSKISEIKEKGHLDSVKEERYQKYFGWLPEYKSITDIFEFMAGTVDFVKGILRKFGLSRETFLYIKMFFETSDATVNERLSLFVKKVVVSVEEECKKLDEGQILICSTEVLESVFGKFKAVINSGHQGITSNILGIATLVGPKRTREEVKEAMEGCSVKTLKKWVADKIGTTLGSIRHRFFKETKFDSNEEPVFYS